MPTPKKPAPTAQTVKRQAERMSRGAAQQPAAKRQMSPYERIRLMQKVAVMRAEKKTWKQIVTETKVPDRTLRDLYAKYEAETADLDDPLGMVGETLHIYTEGITKLADLSENALSETVQLGATSRMMEAARGRLELLVAIGKVPSRLGIYAEQRDLDRVFSEMGRVLERHGAEPDLIRELLTVIGGGAVEERRQLAAVGPGADMYEEDEEDQ